VVWYTSARKKAGGSNGQRQEPRPDEVVVVADWETSFRESPRKPLTGTLLPTYDTSCPTERAAP